MKILKKLITAGILLFAIVTLFSCHKKTDDYTIERILEIAEQTELVADTAEFFDTSKPEFDDYYIRWQGHRNNGQWSWDEYSEADNQDGVANPQSKRGFWITQAWFYIQYFADGEFCFEVFEKKTATTEITYELYVPNLDSYHIGFGPQLATLEPIMTSYDGEDYGIVNNAELSNIKWWINQDAGAEPLATGETVYLFYPEAESFDDFIWPEQENFNLKSVNEIKFRVEADFNSETYFSEKCSNVRYTAGDYSTLPVIIESGLCEYPFCEDRDYYNGKKEAIDAFSDYTLPDCAMTFNDSLGFYVDKNFPTRPFEYAESFTCAPQATVVVRPVIHVLHRGAPIGVGDNVSEAQINSALASMQNSLGSDFEIKEPIIKRYLGDTILQDYNADGVRITLNPRNDVELNALKLDDSKYFNIFLVTEIDGNNGGNGIQGYAWFPNSSQKRMVNLANTFGNQDFGETDPGFKFWVQHVYTHEAGHHFGLYHTFQGGTCEEDNCTLEGDRVCDTPPMVFTTGCDSLGRCESENVGVSMRSYMSYSNCKPRLFTDGQRERMADQINTYYPGYE